MDPILCCLLGICCPPFSEGQRDALTKALTDHFDGDEAKAKKVVDVIYDDFAKVTARLAGLVKEA